MYDIMGEARKNCIVLFNNVPRWRAFIQSALEEGYGMVKADHETEPSMAVIFYGGLVIYGGNSGKKGAKELVRQFPVQPAVLDYDPGWSTLLSALYSDSVSRIKRYHLPFDSHDHKITKDICRQNPANIRRIKEKDWDSLEKNLGWEHHLRHFSGSEDFIDRGLGYLSSTESAVTSGASAFCRSRDYAECQVTTVEHCRGKGLAQRTGAAFINECYQKELTIAWDSVNERSARLGKRLGYSRVVPYEILEILPETHKSH